MNARVITESQVRVRRLSLCLVAIVALSSMQACSSQQVYGAGQAWQHRECNKIQDTQDRSRCMASSSASYEDYRRQAEAAKGTKQ